MKRSREVRRRSGRGKWGVALALGAGLAAVWGNAWRQVRADRREPLPPAGPRAAAQPAAPSAAPAGASRGASPGGLDATSASANTTEGAWTPPLPWPAATLEDLTAADPLAFPQQQIDARAEEQSAAASESEFAAWEARLASEQSAVLISGGEKRLLVGADEYRVGDSVGGLVIEDIRTGEVVLRAD